MSRVYLHRIARTCPSCGEARTPYTHPVAGTRIDGLCSPYRCNLERTKVLASGPRPATFEPAPLDDAHINRQNILGGAA